MNRKILLVVISTIFFISEATAQTVNIKGIALDSSNQSPLISATVVLNDKNNETKYHDLTNKRGEFEIKEVKSGTYILKITYVGYLDLEKKISVKDKDLNLGNLLISSSVISTDEVNVTANAPIGEQKEDTTIFNATSVKTAPDATTEDLVKKLPGVQVESDGTVKAQGEQVKKVLVDGKQFFGDDPTLALRNLPADVVDKVQIYDKMSEQSEFTGFDDGSSTKTMNILTKNNKRKGQFGKISGGYGHQDKYYGSLNYNLFDNAQRISIMGLTNNVSQQNFSFMDILDIMGGGSGQRGQFLRIASRVMGPGGFTPPPGAQTRMLSQSGAGDYMVGQMDGISTTHAVGINYNDMWTDDIEVTGSYFFNYTSNINDQILEREYTLSTDSLSYYNQNTDSYNKNNNHRLNFRFKFDLDTNNSIILRPNLTLQASNIDNTQFSDYLLSTNNPLNSSDNLYQSNYEGLNFSNELLFRHRFETRGRTFSISINTSANDRNGASGQFTQSIYYKPSQNYDTLNQNSQAPTGGYGLSGNISYTEPITENQQLLISYNVNYNSSNSDKRTYDYNPANIDYDILDTLLSNKFDNYYFTQRGEINYRYKKDEINFTTGLAYQRAELNSLQDFPLNLKMDYKFDNILPSMRLQYKFSKTDNLNIFYRTSTNSPSISQLQNVIDVSNPMQLSTGNPALEQQYSHFLMGRYSSFSSDFNNVFLLFTSFNYKTNTIANSTFIAQKDSILQGGIVLPAGGQLTVPVNLSGSYSLSSFFTYGFPLDFIKSKMNLNIGGIFSRTPSLVNNNTNFSNAYNTNLQIVLTSNISENVDFTISSRGNFAITKNTIREDLNNNYNYYTNSVYLNWIFWEGVFLNIDLRNQFYTGLVQENNNNFTLLNISIGKKLFANNSGEIKLTLFDALKQNKSIQTNVTDYYIEYAQNKILQQYIMLTFSYTLRAFGMQPQMPFGPPGHRHE
ncbi:MAG: TonB-dependent receptor [Bacteroidetes bacterium]|nr:MAG: TonB-dependent receptor [Bacteroidota bacterium]